MGDCSGAGRLLDLDHGTEREVKYDVWHDPESINGQLFLRNTQADVGFDWVEYVGPDRHLVLVLSTGRRLRLGRMRFDGQFTGATFETWASARHELFVRK
jgi:hypothetical protein